MKSLSKRRGDRICHHYNSIKAMLSLGKILKPLPFITVTTMDDREIKYFVSQIIELISILLQLNGVLESHLC